MENQSQPEENLVKKTCRELGITQKELAKRIGLSESSMKRIVATKPTQHIINTINLILENQKLKQELSNVQYLQNSLKQFIQFNTLQ